MTDRDPAPDRIAIEMTRNGSAADLSALLTWIQETFDEEDYSLALDFQTTDSFEFEGPASLPTGEAFASADAPPSSDNQEDASENVDADDEGADQEEIDEDAPETAVSEFEVGDRVRHTGGENGAGKVEKPNPEYGTVLVRFDAGYIRGVRPDRLAHVEDAAATSTAETDEDEGADKTFPLSPGTRKYRIASTLSALSGEGDPTTSRDVFEALAGTEWEEETVDKVSQAVTQLYQDHAVDRVGRGQSNAYLYTLSLSGESVVAQVEEAAETTFADVRDAWVADHAADDVDASQDTSENADDEETDESAPVTERITLNPGTWRFKVGSALYHRDGPQTPDEIEATLSGTAWERSRKHASGDLGSFYRDDVATREKRQTESNGPDPYVYEFTEEGEELIEDAARRAVENDYLLFSDVVEDSDTDGESVADATSDDSDDSDAEDGADESDATGDAGLDRLLGDGAEEADADADEDEEGLSSLFDGTDSDPEDPYESSLERAMSGVDATQD